jgi:hypothetical protein
MIMYPQVVPRSLYEGLNNSCPPRGLSSGRPVQITNGLRHENLPWSQPTGHRAYPVKELCVATGRSVRAWRRCRCPRPRTRWHATSPERRCPPTTGFGALWLKAEPTLGRLSRRQAPSAGTRPHVAMSLRPRRIPVNPTNDDVTNTSAHILPLEGGSAARTVKCDAAPEPNIASATTHVHPISRLLGVRS